MLALCGNTIEFLLPVMVAVCCSAVGSWQLPGVGGTTGYVVHSVCSGRRLSSSVFCALFHKILFFALQQTQVGVCGQQKDEN